MQAPSPAAEPPIDFEAALTRLAGGMPRLSTDAFLQERESKVIFLHQQPSRVHTHYL